MAHAIGGIGPISPTAVRVQDLGSDLTLDQVSVGRVGEGGEIGPLTSGRRVYPSPPCRTALNVNGMTSNAWGALGGNDIPGGIASVRTSVEPLKEVGGIQYPLPERATCLAPLDLSPPPPLDLWGNPLTTDIGRGGVNLVPFQRRQRKL